jgi:hypothetical protein
MRRHSLSSKIDRAPWRAKLLQECWNCHATGLKPGILQTHLGDYGIRDYYGERYSELLLDARGLCAVCAVEVPPELRPSEADVSAPPAE